MEKKIKVFSGHQPNILPYMGFFYKMFQSDFFVLDDDVQYSRTGLHNSNYIRVSNAKHKFTIPVSYEFGDPINKVRINYSTDWTASLYKTLENSYGKAAFFEETFDWLKSFLDKKHEYLADLNVSLIKDISDKFSFGTKIVLASKELSTELSKNERNVFQCKSLGCNVYYSGIGGREYNDIEMYNRNGIEVFYTTYQPVKYRQTGWPFVENLSVLDYVMNKGFSIPENWEKEFK